QGTTWLYPAFVFAAYGEAGRTDKAQAGVEPGYWRITDWDLAWFGYNIFYQHPNDLDHLLDGLRKAGAPELPLGFDANAAARAKLSGSAIAALISGRSFDAMCYRKQTIWHFAADGAATWTFSNLISDPGVSSINGDELCLSCPLMTHNRKACGSVYRNADVADIKAVRGYDFSLVGALHCVFSPRK